MPRTVVLALVLVACSDPPKSAIDAASNGDAATSDGALIDAPGSGLIPGTLNVVWIHGSQNCAQNADPELQEHAYNATTIIFRQNKCRTFEAPFIYLLIGETSALLLDTGATNTPALRNALRARIGQKPLLVAHTHAHGDHVAGDPQFAGQPNTMVVATNLTAIRAAFGTTASTPGMRDLGNRVLDVFEIPGHHGQHLAIYDRNTGLLFTGDTLYPGMLFVQDWTQFRATATKLAQWVGAHPISHVLGAHIEMTSTPRQSYPYMTTFQPNEHVLQLGAAQVMELESATQQLGATPPAAPVAYDHFVIDPP
ncbi:MAG: MBL fold metallo-hydrolase [Kofleriaceae bacterium]